MIFSFLKKYWPSLSIAIIIFILTVFVSNDLKMIPKVPMIGKDKIAHFGVFFVLTLFLIVDIEKNTDFKMSKVLILSFFLTIFYGGSIELIQHWFLESRDGCPYDMMANVAGILSAAFIQSKFKLIKY